MTLHGSCVYSEDGLGSDARPLSGRRIALGRLTVRHAEARDEQAIRRLLETGQLSSRKPGPERSAEHSMVADERGELLAAVCYRTSLGRLILGPLAVDALVAEYRFALALSRVLLSLHRAWARERSGSSRTSTASTCWRRDTAGASAAGVWMYRLPKAIRMIPAPTT